jgi:D-alanyl-D-alanine carboxypeptidase (penicillin-binding protein 5/6)
MLAAAFHPNMPANRWESTVPHRMLLTAVLLLAAFTIPLRGQLTGEKALPPRAPEDRLDGPPLVTARAWAITDAATGKLLWGSGEAEPRAIASTTKVMTAWIVLREAARDPKALDEIVRFSEKAARTPGSSARLRAGERLPVRDLLYGLLLPSGNDAAVALAEHFGPRFQSEGQKEEGTIELFVAEMNRRARALKMAETTYHDPHGLSKNLSSARDLTTLTLQALKDPPFRRYVQTRRHRCEVLSSDGEKRTVSWDNTNQLLGIEGYDGVKTGTTNAAGSCLIASGRRGSDHLLVVVLGSTSNDGRYIDSRNLFRWAWRQRGHKPPAPPP